MAEFCLDCWNKLHGTNAPQCCYVLSKSPELCEGCGKQKRVIIAVRSYSLWRKFSFLFFPFRIFFLLFSSLRKLFLHFTFREKAKKGKKERIQR